jgi:S1-C subfamily serine protease
MAKTPRLVRGTCPNLSLNPTHIIAQGTGFFVSTEGHLLTCHHVVKDAKEISVTTPNGEKYLAKIIQQDPVNDILLCKVDINQSHFSFQDRKECRKATKFSHSAIL